MASTHTATIKLADGREVFQSYGVTVAAFIPEGFTIGQGGCDYKTCHVTDPCRHSQPRGYLRTDGRWSVTTSRHMNAYAGRDAATVPHAVLLALTSPVESRE